MNPRSALKPGMFADVVIEAPLGRAWRCRTPRCSCPASTAMPSSIEGLVGSAGGGAVGALAATTTRCGAGWPPATGSRPAPRFSSRAKQSCATPCRAGARQSRPAGQARRADQPRPADSRWTTDDRAPHRAVGAPPLRGDRARGAGDRRRRLVAATDAARRRSRSLRRAGHRLQRMDGAIARSRRGPDHLPDHHRAGRCAACDRRARPVDVRDVVRERHLRGRHRSLLGAQPRARVHVEPSPRSCPTG